MEKTTEESKWGSLRISKKQLARLKAHCDETGHKMATLVSRLIDEMFASHKAKKQG